MEVVDKFCYYIDDILSVVGDADAPVEARIRIGLNKFRQLVPLLTNRDISLIYVKKLQFIHTVNGDGSKTAKIIKRHY